MSIIEETVEGRIRNILLTVLGDKTMQIGLDDLFYEDLKCNTHEKEIFLLHLEEEFDLNIPDDFAEKCISIRTTVTIVDEIFAEST